MYVFDDAGGKQWEGACEKCVPSPTWGGCLAEIGTACKDADACNEEKRFELCCPRADCGVEKIHRVVAHADPKVKSGEQKQKDHH